MPPHASASLNDCVHATAAGAVDGALTPDTPWASVFFAASQASNRRARQLMFWNDYTVPVAVHDVRLLGDAAAKHFEVRCRVTGCGASG